MSAMSHRVNVERYNKDWPVWFEDLCSFIKSILGSLVIRIEHVGSTSIPGMVSKPIIDLDVVILRQDFEEVKSLLANVGYEHEGDLGIMEREAFKLTNPLFEKKLPPHHLYVCDIRNEELRKHIAFRDYLRTHPHDLRRYSDIKIQLVKKSNGDRDFYIDGKSDLIEEILENALLWFKNNNP